MWAIVEPHIRWGLRSPHGKEHSMGYMYPTPLWAMDVSSHPVFAPARCNQQHAPVVSHVAIVWTEKCATILHPTMSLMPMVSGSLQYKWETTKYSPGPLAVPALTPQNSLKSVPCDTNYESGIANCHKWCLISHKFGLKCNFNACNNYAP